MVFRVCCVNTAVNFFVMSWQSPPCIHDLHIVRRTTSAVRVAVSNSCSIVPCHQRRTLSTERGCSRSSFFSLPIFIAPYAQPLTFNIYDVATNLSATYKVIQRKKPLRIRRLSSRDTPGTLITWGRLVYDVKTFSFPLGVQYTGETSTWYYVMKPGMNQKQGPYILKLAQNVRFPNRTCMMYHAAC